MIVGEHVGWVQGEGPLNWVIRNSWCGSGCDFFVCGSQAEPGAFYRRAVGATGISR